MEREVPLQRLVHFRDNWYLDAWCHLRNEFVVLASMPFSGSANWIPRQRKFRLRPSTSPWERGMASLVVAPKDGPNCDGVRLIVFG